MDIKDAKLLLKVETAAELCDMGRSKFWELVMAGEIESIKIGRSRRIPADALRAWVGRQTAVEDSTA
tara:strand:+ start:8532 stop:8732 length:201 start_codon:yes stop_codon:yes gene_type:complete